MLERDHVNARALAVGFSQIPGIVCDPSAVASNIVYFRVLGLPAGEVVRRLKEEYNVLLGIGAYRGDRLRAVTNLMVTEQDVVRVVAAMAEIVGETNREKVDKACAIFKDTAVAV
jgi:threonine aldolase